jgi:hypothetical protein
MSRLKKTAIVTVVALTAAIGFNLKAAYGADALPDGMAGFSGTLQGTVIAKGREGFTLKVKKIVRTWKKNRAKNPQSAIGKSLELVAGNKFHQQFIRTLKKGEELTIEAKAKGDGLQILELNGEQRKRIGIGKD